MATLRPSTGSASALLRTAGSLATAAADYQDSLKAFEYSNSAYTDQAFADYSTYLNGRISGLSSGGVSSASKALSLTRALDTAGKSNISAGITRENIQIMAGNASPQDKLNLIQDQFVRAYTSGDMTLAQSLESQAYSLSQSIQLQAQQAADARATLDKAAASAAKTAAVDKQADIVTNLEDGLKVLNASSLDKNQADFTKAAQQFVKDNKDTYSTLGVTFAKGDGTPNTSPNYFNIVKGVAVAKYNALVLKAQAETAINPQKASQYATDAYLFANSDKIQTLAGGLTLQQVQEASQSPNMFVYDNANGKYVQSTKTGFQSQSFTGYKTVDGKVTPYTYKAIVPTFSSYASGEQASKVYFLTPTQTTLMSKLGLQIEAKVNSNGTVGTGIKAQASGNTPDWLTKIISKGGEDQFFNQNGQLSFASGGKFYTLSQDGRGLIGLTEHSADGTSKIVGGNYGFNPNPASKGGNGLKGTDDSISSLRGQHMNLNSRFEGVNKLIAQAQVQEAAVAVQNQAAAKAMLSLPSAPLPNISIAPNVAPPSISQAPAPRQPTITWKAPSTSVAQAPKVASPAIAPAAPGSFNLQGGGGSIRLQ